MRILAPALRGTCGIRATILFAGNARVKEERTDPALLVFCVNLGQKVNRAPS